VFSLLPVIPLERDERSLIRVSVSLALALALLPNRAQARMRTE